MVGGFSGAGRRTRPAWIGDAPASAGEMRAAQEVAHTAATRTRPRCWRDRATAGYGAAGTYGMVRSRSRM